MNEQTRKLGLRASVLTALIVSAVLLAVVLVQENLRPASDLPHYTPPALWAPDGWEKMNGVTVNFTIEELDESDNKRVGHLDFSASFEIQEVNANLSIASLDLRVCNQAASKGVLLQNLSININSTSQNRAIATFEWLGDAASPYGAGYCRTLHQTKELAQ